MPLPLPRLRYESQSGGQGTARCCWALRDSDCGPKAQTGLAWGVKGSLLGEGAQSAIPEQRGTAVAASAAREHRGSPAHVPCLEAGDHLIGITS